MATFNAAPEPPTELGRLRVLSPNCGLRVSPLTLGGMSIGENWKDFMGHSSKEDAFALLDAFVEAGGQFIDTANNYTDGQSEEWIGEWAETRGFRDELVIATKYTTFYEPNTKKFRANYSGNSFKSMYLSVEASLKKLRTSYIDILYLHWWDWTTPIEEVMQGLNVLVKQGKVLYLGISDSPAWVVAQANQYAKDHGLAPFVIYQGRWNLSLRDFEREILPMCRAHGLAIAPWAVVGGGKFQTKKQMEERKKAGEGLRKMKGEGQTEEEVKVSEALDTVATELGVGIQAVAIAYVLAKYPYTFPIIGGRKVEHLKSNIQALDIKLTSEQIKALEEVTDFDIGFPLNFIQNDPRYTGGKHENFLVGFSGHFKFPEAGKFA